MLFSSGLANRTAEKAKPGPLELALCFKEICIYLFRLLIGLTPDQRARKQSA